MTFWQFSIRVRAFPFGHHFREVLEPLLVLTIDVLNTILNAAPSSGKALGPKENLCQSY